MTTVTLTEGAAKALALIATRNELRVAAAKVEAQLADVSADDRALVDQVLELTAHEAIDRWWFGDESARRRTPPTADRLIEQALELPAERHSLVVALLGDDAAALDRELEEMVPDSWKSPLAAADRAAREIRDSRSGSPA
jgi:hypothetical protein